MASTLQQQIELKEQLYRAKSELKKILVAIESTQALNTFQWITGVDDRIVGSMEQALQDMKERRNQLHRDIEWFEGELATASLSVDLSTWST